VTGWLLRLGGGGLWPPAGLVADLVTLTGPPGNDQDARLGALASEPGIARLRDLAAGEPRWRPNSRTAFAALLASALVIPDTYIPPDEPLADLRTALTDALISGAAGAGAPWPVPLADLRAAAAGISDRTLTLLAILGPDACAADPLLPVRLAHQIPQLPVLSQRELRLLAVAGSAAVSGGAVTAGTMTWSPGTAGVTRTGPPTRLLPTQLALPRDLMTIKLAEDQLLYRQHRAPAPPAPEPVTIILDTSPPTYGPAGTALRLAAHLITTSLWAHGRHPTLVTLADPHTVRELHATADLMGIWASGTLEDPAAALATARRTAAAAGQPAVLCTHFHTARDHGYRPQRAARLLTTHQPSETPPARPAGPWHAHLPPDPGQAPLAAAIGRLLTPDHGNDA
jgi:hypothetical protein